MVRHGGGGGVGAYTLAFGNFSWLSCSFTSVLSVFNHNNLRALLFNLKCTENRATFKKQTDHICAYDLFHRKIEIIIEINCM